MNLGWMREREGALVTESGEEDGEKLADWRLGLDVVDVHCCGCAERIGVTCRLDFHHMILSS